MIRQLGSVAERVFRRTCPDPFVIAILLAVAATALALAFGDWSRLKPGESAPAALLDAARGETGLWKFLSFGMQMCLILVTGHALAATRQVRRLIAAMGAWPRTAGQAAALVGAVACISGVINWGLSLIVGALTAREVGRSCHARGIRAHYPLLAASGFLGLLVWHGGLSGSAPLTMTSQLGAEKVLPKQYAEQLGPGGVPLSATIFSPMNLFLTGGLLIGVPLLLLLLTPRRTQDIRTYDAFVQPGDRPADALPLPDTDARMPTIESGSGVSQTSPGTIPDWLDRSWIVAILIAIPFVLAVGRSIWMQGGAAAGWSASPLWIALQGLNKFGLNEINGSMLAIGLLLHGSPRAYMAAVEDGARGCGGIIVQFPIYGGIVAIVESSGLITQIAGWFASVGNATTIPLMTFLAAGVINFFIPSGGAQWAVQGPIAMQTAVNAGIDDFGKMVMAVAYGDQTTNMLQPFWALPLLSITGVQARDIVGYTAVVMLFAGAWMALGLVLF